MVEYSLVITKLIKYDRAQILCYGRTSIIHFYRAMDFLLFTIVMSAFAPVLIRVFMNESQIIVNGAMMLRCQQIGMIFMAITLITTCLCQSVGNALGAFILSISRQGILYAIALVIMSRFMGYTGVLISQACADIVTAVIAIGIMRKILKS